MKTFSILIICLLSVNIYADCNQPQTVYHIAGSSLFYSINDISESLIQVFQNKLQDITRDDSKTLHQQTYTLQDIIPYAQYKSDQEKESLGPNSIVKSGGVLELSVEFKFDYVDGTKRGSGLGIGKFPAPYPVTLTKMANFQTGSGLSWVCEFTNLNLVDMSFMRESGTEPEAKYTTIFTDFLNKSDGTNQSVKDQIQMLIKSVQPDINTINNQVVSELFRPDSLYEFLGKKMTINESLLGYSLDGSGETMSLQATMSNSVVCRDTGLFVENQGSYFSVSTSVVENSFNYLVSNNLLTNPIDNTNWHIPNFYFTVRDLSFLLPKITQKHDLNESIGGNCIFASGNPPAYSEGSNAFNVKMKYACSLNTLKDSNLVMTFMVTASLSLVPEFDEIQSVKVVVTKSVFEGSEYSPSPSYGDVSNPKLMDYYISIAANSLLNSSVFGTGLINLPPQVTTPSWKMSNDFNTIYFYDSSSASTIAKN